VPTEYLGIVLRDARTRLGLGVRELARRADVPASTVSRVESGKLKPSPAVLARLAAALGMAPCLRPEGDGDGPKAEASPVAQAWAPAVPRPPRTADR